MRLKQAEIETIHELVNTIFSFDVKIYLFGSRTNDLKKGGDIDLLFLTEKPIQKYLLRKFRVAFYKKYGWQKIDIVNFQEHQESTFRALISKDAVLL